MNTTITRQGYKITITGNVPEGKDYSYMMDFIKKTGLSAGAFKMGVLSHNKDKQTVSKIKFNQLV